MIPVHAEIHHGGTAKQTIYFFVSRCLRGGRSSAAVSDMHDVAVLHDVVLAFEAEGAFGTGGGFRAGFEKLVPADGFGADEVFFQVGVDCACSLLSPGVGGDLPGAAFVLSGGEERDQPKELIGGTDEANQPAFL